MPLRGVLRHEAVTVAGTAIGMTVTAAQGVRPDAAIITVESAAIRFTVDGTTPTATVGHLAEPGDVIELVDGQQVRLFSAIRQGGTSATIMCTQGNEYVL